MADVSSDRKALQRKATLFAPLGIVLSLIAQLFFIGSQRDSNPMVVAAAFSSLIASVICWYIGLGAFARSKGYPGTCGALGLLGCVGALILALMPNRWIDPPTDSYGPGDYPRPNL